MSDLNYQPSCVCSNLEVDVYRHRDSTLTYEINDPEDKAGDITGAKVWFSVKNQAEDADVDAVISKASTAAGGSDAEIEIVTPIGAVKVISVYIVPADTVDVDNGDRLYDIVLELPMGPRRIQLVDPTRFTILQPITNATV